MIFNPIFLFHYITHPILRQPAASATNAVHLFKPKAYAESAPAVLCAYAPAHAFGQHFCYRKPQTHAAGRRLYGIKPVKQPLGAHVSQSGGGIGKQHSPALKQSDREVAVRIFCGIAEDIVKHTSERP